MVISPTWALYRGNGGNGKGGFDSLNNNEQVYVATPVVGRYQVRYMLVHVSIVRLEFY